MRMNEDSSRDSDEFPAVIGDPEVARILGMHKDWISFLEGRGHLRSLGGRGRGCQRFYASSYVLGLRNDEDWLDRAIKMVRAHFRAKNARNGGSGE